MNYTNNWSKSMERFAAFWKNEIIDRCCISVFTPKSQISPFNSNIPKSKKDLLKYWTDGESILKRYIDQFENLYFTGDAFPLISLNLGASGHAAFFKNAKYSLQDTVWFKQSIYDWNKDLLEFDAKSFLYKKTFELAQYFSNESKGQYIVSMPDISGNLDVLSHLRGAENILIDLAEDNKHVVLALDKIQKVWENTNLKIFDMLKKSNYGGSSIGWLQTWAPGFHAQMQSDISVMISPSLYKKYVLPEIKKQSSFLEYPLYHLDGIEQIRHLDMLLSIKNLKVIQWTQVSAQPSVLEFIPVLKKIQSTKKGLVILVSPTQVAPLLENLSSKGLYLVTHTNTKDEANKLIKIANKLSHE